MNRFFFIFIQFFVLNNIKSIYWFITKNKVRFYIIYQFLIALSEPGGRGRATLGFSERVAREMVLGRGLFTECRVLHEADNTRWFEVTR